MLNGVEIIPQFPSLSLDEIDVVENKLRDRFAYKNIPEEYKSFLQKTNGCLFKLDEDEDLRLLYKLNLPFIDSVSVAGIFGVWQSKYEGVANIYPELPELFASNENSKENFCILPDEMMSFSYEDTSSGSLFAISVADKDFGQVYFYYDDYMYSVFSRERLIEKQGYCYFDKKIEDILKKYNIDEKSIQELKGSGRLDVNCIIESLNNLSEECIFELERAQFIPIAPSFNEFIKHLKVEQF